VTQSVVIVGAGIIGCSIARELSVRGVACTVLDDRGIAGGATQASAGMLAPYVEAHDAGPMLDLGVRSLRMYPEWIAGVRRDAGIDVEYAAIGTLEVATAADAVSASKAAAAAHGRWLDAADVAGRHPELRACEGGRLTQEHGYVVPPQLANALALAAERRGAGFRAARVERVRRRGTGFALETTSGAIDADAVIVAAGAWANGIEGIRTPPVRPVRGQIVQLAWPGQTLQSILWGPRCYVVPRLDRSILVGATVEDAGYDERTTAEGIRGLLDAACDLLPAARAASFLDARAGLRPATPDDLPVLGDDPAEPGIIHAAGHYRNGILLAPITAKLIADLAIDGTRDACLQHFRVDRFS
jgi:glycine oxidase ThiO